MKKIVTILICVLLGVGSAFGAEVAARITSVFCEGNICTLNDGGWVYIMYDNSNIESCIWNSTTSYYKQDVTPRGNRYLYCFAKPYSGNWFAGWASAYNANGTYTTANYYHLTTLSSCNGTENPAKFGASKYVSSGTNHNYYAIFKPQVAYLNYAEAEVVLIDENNIPIMNGSEYEAGACKVGIDNVPMSNRVSYGEASQIIGLNSFPNGSWKYTYKYNKSEIENNYVFIGWFIADDDGNLPKVGDKLDLNSNKGTGETYTYTLTTDKRYSEATIENAPRVKKVYAVFRPKFNLYNYDKVADQFSQDAMSSTIEDSKFKYSDNMGNEKETLYKIVHYYGNQVMSVRSTTGDFSGYINDIQGMTVLHVKAEGSAEELVDDLEICLGEGAGADPIAELHLIATNKPIYVTLNPAEGFTGTYTFWQNTDANEVTTVTTSVIKRQMLTSTDYSFTFNAIPNANTQFEKWVVYDADGNPKETLRTSNVSYRFEANESITPFFKEKDLAVFIVKSEPYTKYVDLQKALDRAEALGGNQVVTVYAPTGSTEVRLQTGNYTVRGGVTLLIPGESTYISQTGALTVDDCTAYDNYKVVPDRSVHCKLIVDDNTNITVEEGNISVYSKIAVVQNNNGGRLNHGWIQLGKNCNITVEDGGLYAFGFITGDPSSKVTMKDGTIAYEVFQFTDWRGGKETYEVKNKGVFPLGQYYVQSVEVPLEIQSGAQLMASTAVDLTVGGMLPTKVRLIAPTTASDYLFGLSTGSSITKSYDPKTDRIKFELNGSGLSNPMKVGHVKLTLPGVGGLGEATFDSKDFVLPIQNNMDIVVKNATVDVDYKLAFMPDARLYINTDAVVNINSNSQVYVYDADARGFGWDGGEGYWGTYNTAPTKPLYTCDNGRSRPSGERPYTPSDDKYKYVRSGVSDASFYIDGVMNVSGALYTVMGALQVKDANNDPIYGGANITSHGGGKINVNNIGSATVTYQLYESNTKSIDLTNKVEINGVKSNLWLHNDEKENPSEKYTMVTNDNKGTYVYYAQQGKWVKSVAGISDVKLYNNVGQEIDEFLNTIPKDPTSNIISGYLLASLEKQDDVTYQVENFQVTPASQTNENMDIVFGTSLLLDNAGNTVQNITSNSGYLKIPVTFTVSNISREIERNCTIQYKQTAAITTTIKAKEDYTPKFTVPSTLTLNAPVYGSDSKELTITYSDDNILSLPYDLSVSNQNPKWTASGLQGTAFECEFVTNNGKISGVKIMFSPTDLETPQTATLSLTATYYKDANTVDKSTTHTVKLIGNPLTIDNTLDFNHPGTITLSTTAFDMLRFINSPGAISYEILEGVVDTSNDEVDAENAIFILSPKNGTQNYTLKPNKVGSVTIKVTQDADVNSFYKAKTITKTFVVTATPEALGDGGQCADTEANFNKLTSSLSNVQFDGTETPAQIQFGADSYWAIQFDDMPGIMTFTPHGTGKWTIEESKGDGQAWYATAIYKQTLPDTETKVNIHPTSRRVRISYEGTEGGYITGLCIAPFSIYAVDRKVYVPVNESGVVQSKEVVFLHSGSARPNSITLTPLQDLDQDVDIPVIADIVTTQVGFGVLNPYYETRVTLSGGTNVPELNNSFKLTAIQGDKSDEMLIGTFAAPKPLPIESNSWVSDSEKPNVNGYDESEHYYHYMVSSSNVRWDANADSKSLVFLDVTGKAGAAAERSVTFGFYGLPHVVRFESQSKDWKIEEKQEGENRWTEHILSIPQQEAGSSYQIEQTISKTADYVRITYVGTLTSEELLNNLEIKGATSAIPVLENQPTTPISEFSISNDQVAVFYIHVMNLDKLKLALDNTAEFTLRLGSSTGSPITFTDGLSSSFDEYTSNNKDVLQMNEEGWIPIHVQWRAQHIADLGTLQFINPDNDNEVLSELLLIGGKIVTKGMKSGIWTGVPDGKTAGRPTEEAYILADSFEPYKYHEVDLTNIFEHGEGKNAALFDYVIIYGETTTDGSNHSTDENGNIIITTPGTPALEEKGSGSNALTPYYILKKNSAGDGYYFLQMVENANSPTKAIRVLEHEEGQTSLSCYITGFCPYATTGYTFEDEGVWYFRGPAGTRVDIYLEDCHIYSRNKSEFGAKYGKNHAHISWFNEQVVQGSGAVLVFENKIDDIQNYPTCRGAEEGCQVDTTFDVAIHTIGHNVLKSNYGSYLNVLGMSGKLLVAQVSAPVQVRLGDKTHVNVAKTILDFDDKWPTAISENQNGGFDTTFVRTNGFLSLQKQQNYAPSIDLGNRHTIVNFRGGQVQLQNAAIKSPNYKTTLAISWRGGKMGNIDDFLFAYGLGTDSVSGTVNFYDGTTTVIPMKVDGVYQDFYLMDEDNPNYTSCLRTPTNTFIYGGSHCMLRACNYVTSKGGAPKDGPGGNFLGLYKYPYASWTETKDGQEITHKGGWTTNGEKGLVSIPEDNLPNANYGDESITPNTNGTDTIPNDDYLNLWVTKGYDDNVNIEEDKELHYWYACMTKIEGGGLGVNAKVGGDIEIEDDDEIRNLLYCQLDDYIYDVISATDGVMESGDPNYTYTAPAKDPSGQMDEPYYRIGLTNVSDQKQHKIIRESDYEVTNKLYYITTAKADTWMNFTMPFDVARIWIVEAFDESLIEANFAEYKEADEALTDEDKKANNYLSPMEKIKMFQARHNADFAAFFAMAMAIGTYGKDFGQILDDYMNWAIIEDEESTDSYSKRGLYELEHYDGSNFTSAHYYLYKNMGNWQLTEDYEVSTARWEVAPSVTDNGGILMNKGETYSMLFPYCTGCDVELDEDNNIVVDEFGLPVLKTRDYWDYWSGKLLIFESTAAPKKQPHVIRGSNYIAASKVDTDTPWIFDGISSTSGSGILTGNSTFSMMSVKDYHMRDDIFTYDDTPYVETFLPAELDENTLNPIYETLVPTESFLLANYHKPIKLITRNGRVVTDDRDDQGNGNQGTTTGGHMPTVGGGHDMLITGTADGINVAVASPQMVYVVTPAGTIIYSGYVESNINIPLPMSGIYIVKGENEVQKIFY